MPLDVFGPALRLSYLTTELHYTRSVAEGSANLNYTDGKHGAADASAFASCSSPGEKCMASR